MEPVQLKDETLKIIEEVGSAEILVGIPSFNNADTIAHVVRAVQAGVTKYFPDSKTILVNSDGGSTDGTQEIVARTAIDDFNPLLIRRKQDMFSKIVTPYHGLPGKGSAFRTMFDIARRLGVKACAVVDSDLRSITPEWIDLLIRPVLELDFDFVTPHYLRHKYDGTITNSIIYPITRALYGKHLRQPIGGDFGFSGRLAEYYLSKDVWGTDVARFGIDIWMTTTAVANDFKICEAFLGAKIHAAKDPGADLSAMLIQVISSVFMLMEEYSGRWKMVKDTMPVPMFGFQFSVGLEPINVNVERMIHLFHTGLRDLSELFKEIMDPVTLEDIQGIARAEPHFFDDDTWVRIIYDYALAWHARVMSQEHILGTLTPLYLGKVASLVMELEESSAAEVEDRLSALCFTYEKRKPYLAERWA